MCMHARSMDKDAASVARSLRTPLALAALGLALLAQPARAQTCTASETQLFRGTIAGSYPIAVPAGITRLRVELAGAEGGSAVRGGRGGEGGKVAGTLTLPAGTTSLLATVGGKGEDADGSDDVGGFNGGGDGNEAVIGSSGDGGGATDLRLGGSSPTNRIAAAGGGGGGGFGALGFASSFGGLLYGGGRGGDGGANAGGGRGLGAVVPNFTNGTAYAGTNSPGVSGGNGGAGNIVFGDDDDADDIPSAGGLGGGGGGGGAGTSSIGGGGGGAGGGASPTAFGNGGSGGGGGARGQNGEDGGFGISEGGAAGRTDGRGGGGGTTAGGGGGGWTGGGGGGGGGGGIGFLFNDPDLTFFVGYGAGGGGGGGGNHLDPALFTNASLTAGGNTGDGYALICYVAPVAANVTAFVAYGSSDTAISLGLAGDVTGVAVATPAAHGTAIANGSTITYTPSAGYAGPDSFTYTVSSDYGTSAPGTVSITVSTPTVTYAPVNPPAATAGLPYSHSLASASGGIAPYTYLIVSGALPPGVTLAGDGTLHGTPTVAGTYNFRIRATDSSTGVGPFSAASSNLSLVVGQGTQAITNFIATPSIPAYTPGGSFLLSASGGLSGNPVVFASTTPAICTVSDNTATMLATGTCSLTANQAGNASFSAAPQATLSVNIAANAQAITNFIATPAAPTYAAGGTFAVSATGGASGNPVVFTSATTAICTVTGSTVAMLGIGVCSLTADQAGNAGYADAPQVRLDVTIAAAAQAITNFAANPAAPTYAQGGTFSVSATPGASTSPVVFASTTPVVCTISGSTVTMLRAGTCSLTANQAGDANYSAVPEVRLDVAIAAITQAITNFAANPAAPTYAQGGTFGISATPGASTSPVVFASTTAATCTVNGSTVAILGAGTCSLTANQAGDANHGAAPEVTLDVPIAVGTQQITHFIATPTAPTYAPRGTFALAATPGASTSLVVFASATPSICTVSGSIATMLGAGTCSLTANQAADSNYQAASEVALDVTIRAGTQAITGFASDPVALTYAPGGTFALVATPGASTSPLVFASTTPAVCSVSGSTATMLGAGMCSLTANQAADGNYQAAPEVVLDVTIAAAVPTLGWIEDVRKVLGEAAFELPNPTSNSPGGFTFASSNAHVATIAGRTVTLVGAGTTTLTATQAATANYTAATISMTLTVEVRPAPGSDSGVATGIQAQVDASLRFVATQQSNVQDRLRQLRSARGTPSSYALAVSYSNRYGNGIDMPVGGPRRAEDASFGVWTAGNVVLDERSPRNGADGFELHSDGITIGMDRDFGDMVFGAAFGAGWGKTGFADPHSKQDAMQRSLTVYGLWRNNAHWHVDGLLGWGQLGFDLARWSEHADALAIGTRKGDQQFGALTLGYTHDDAGNSLTGYGRLAASRTTLDAYRETGLGIYDLDYREQRIDSATLAAGIEGQHQWRLGDRLLRPFWSLEYRSALRDDGQATVNYVVLPNATDDVLRLRSHLDNGWAFDAGFDMELWRDWRLSVGYRREQGRDGITSDGLNLRLSFDGWVPPPSLTPMLTTQEMQGQR